MKPGTKSLNRLSCLLIVHMFFISAFSQGSNEKARAYFQRAGERKDVRDYSGAVNYYDSALFYGYSSSVLFLNRGDAKVKIKDFDGAMKDYNHAIEISPESILQYVKRGELKHEIKDYDGAISDFTKEIGLNPRYWIAFSNRGFTEHIIGKYKEAIEDYTKAIEFYPDPPYLPYYICRGHAKYENGEYQGAVDDYSYVINFDIYGGDYLEIFIMLGRAQRMLKDYEDAMRSFNEHIHRYPNDGMGYYERAMLNSELGNTKKVCEDLQVARDLKYEFDFSLISKYCE